MAIDRGDIRQAIDRCSNIWASLPGAGYGCSSICRQPDCKIKVGGTVRLMLSRVAIICPVICIIVCLSWAVNHYRDNAITYKAQRQKCQRTGRRTRHYWHGVAAWCCCARCKIHEGVSLSKPKMMLCVMMLLVVVGCIISSSSVSAWSYHASGVDNAASPWLADTAERDYFTLRERLINIKKQPEGNPEVYEWQADRAAHRWGNSCNYWAIHYASSGV